MDSTYEIRNNCLFLKVTGDFDNNRSIEIIYETHEKLLTHNLTMIFCDVTDVTGLEYPRKPILSIYDLSSMISTYVPSRTKIVILGTEKQVGKYAFFEDEMIKRGFSVKVTSKPEEGLRWLSEEKS